MRYSKVVVNIPETLIKRFDNICEREGFTRQEAIKQAMRDFIYDYTDENEVQEEQVRAFWKSTIQALQEAEESKQIPKQLELKK